MQGTFRLQSVGRNRGPLWAFFYDGWRSVSREGDEDGPMDRQDAVVVMVASSLFAGDTRRCVTHGIKTHDAGDQVGAARRTDPCPHRMVLRGVHRLAGREGPWA